MDYITEIELGRDRRYMRGDGNILVRKNRIKKGVMKWLLYLFLASMAFVLFSFAAKEAYLYLITTSDLDVRHINISGNRIVSEEALRSVLTPLLKKNILSIDLEQWKKRVLMNPWIKEVSIKRDLPSTIQMEIEERIPVIFFLWKGKTYLADNSGTPISEYQPEYPEYDFPFVTGIEAKSTQETLHKLHYGVNILEKIKKHKPALHELISEIGVKENDCIILRLRDGSSVLYLDQDNFKENLDYYFSIKEDIDKQFERAEYIDLRWENRVIVKPLSISR